MFKPCSLQKCLNYLYGVKLMPATGTSCCRLPAPSPSEILYRVQCTGEGSGMFT